MTPSPLYKYCGDFQRREMQNAATERMQYFPCDDPSPVCEPLWAMGDWRDGVAASDALARQYRVLGKFLSLQTEHGLN